MLKAGYAELEAKADRGVALITIAAVVHIAASTISLGLMRGTLIGTLFSILVPIGLYAALYTGRGWARWFLVVQTAIGASLASYLLISGTLEANVFIVGRTAVSFLVILLLLLPPVKAYIDWKRLRF